MKKGKIFGKIVSWSFALFFAGTLMLMFYKYILNEQPATFLFYITISSLGVGLVSLLLNSFLSMKDYDLDYFKNIMIGISGGLAVWVFSEIDLSFKEGFWLTINEFMIRVGFSLMIILIGYSLYKKKNE